MVSADHPLLVTPAVPFPFDTEDPDRLAAAMLAVMEEKRGLGLAANQVGLPWAMFVLAPEPQAIFNPEIIRLEGENILEQEGCLTYPRLFVKIKRAEHAILRFQDRTGAFQEQRFSDIPARIVQHEQGHMDGKVFYNAASRFHRDAALKKWKKS